MMGEGDSAMRRGLRRYGVRHYRRKPGVARAPKLARLTGGLLALALAAAGCGTGAPKGPGKRMVGGTATYALPPNTTPSYIFPFTPSQYFTQVNTDNLQFLL